MFEEYMQNILGYTRNINTYNMNFQENKGRNNMYQDLILPQMKYINMQQNINGTWNSNLEEMYPDIYNIIYPMVKEACMRNTKNIDKNLINEMAKEIYENLEPSNNSVEININLRNETTQRKENNNLSKEIMKHEKNKSREYESSNTVLNDLIKILILRELTERPGCCGPNRPPMSPPPPRF